MKRYLFDLTETVHVFQKLEPDQSSCSGPQCCCIVFNLFVSVIVKKAHWEPKMLPHRRRGLFDDVFLFPSR